MSPYCIFSVNCVTILCVLSVLRYCWLGLLTCKNRRPYNLYCVGVAVKPCSIYLSVLFSETNRRRKLQTHLTLVGTRVSLSVRPARQLEMSQIFPVTFGGTVAAAPPPFRPSKPAFCGSCPLVTPYYCKLGDLLCFVFIVRLVYFSVIDVL